MSVRVRVELPSGLSALAGVGREVVISLAVPATQRSLLDALEEAFPMLRGTMRDHVSKKRRAYVRFFGCETDLSHVALDEPLPAAIVEGRDVFMVVGAIAGG